MELVTISDSRTARTLLAILTTFATFLLLEIPIASAMILLGILTLVYMFGELLAVNSGVGRVGLGSGLILGAGALVFSVQILLLLHVPSNVAHWLVIALMVVAVITTKNPEHLQSVKYSSLTALTGLSISVVVYAVLHPWLWPFAIAVVALERSLNLQKRVSYWIVATLMTSSYWISSELRPDRWWYFYQNHDINLFESLSWSLSRWGVFEHPGNVGGSVFEYHWLSYAFFGGLSQLAHLEPWTALLKAGPLLLQFVFVSAILAIPRANNFTLNGRVWLIVTLANLATIFGRPNSLNFSLAVLVGAIMLVTQAQNAEMRFLSNVLLHAFVTFVVIFSKTTTGLYFGAFLVFLMMFNVRHLSRKKLAPICGYVVVSLPAYWYVFRGTGGEARLRQILSPSLDAFLEHTILSRGFVALLILGYLIYLQYRDDGPNLSTSTWRSPPVKVALLLAVSASASSIFLPDPHHYTEAAFVALVFIGSRAVIQHEPRLNANYRLTTTRSSLWILAACGVFAGATYPILVNRVASMSTLDEQLGSMIWRLIAKLGIFVALLSAVVILYRIPKLGRLAPSGLAVLALGVGTITGLGSDASRRVATWGADVYENWKFNESAFPNAEKREVAKFIRENTPASAIVATNDFCCFGDFWWTETLRATRRQQTPNWDLILRESAWGQKLLAGDDGSDREVIRYAENSISFGGSSFQLAAEAQRRFLILGLKWQLTGFPPAPTPQQIERMSASLNFANSPSTSAVERLRRYGVSGYVVNLELTSGKDYSRFAEELFRNGKFAYLKIG